MGEGEEVPEGSADTRGALKGVRARARIAGEGLAYREAPPEHMLRYP